MIVVSIIKTPYMELPTAASMYLVLWPQFAHTMIIGGSWPERTAKSSKGSKFGTSQFSS
jgi:hypothetical protein